ncbi:hypothetical protein [Anditalea andensis]|uniref:Uncharacterized protein n=1 Tax=Anditalea andensis TaxID=1048983 RepID=A0A074L384_9BACT|nr:hypothetical protein [Anditalea andensis]KEO75604.1 hypothetical protein EL17_00485 [Anditalea andensis]
MDTHIVPHNVTAELLNSAGVPVTVLTPSTNYTLRVRATAGTCSVVGSGCNSGAAIIAFIIEYAAGCTIQGHQVPPNVVAMDTGSALNYTSNFTVTTNPPASFGGQVSVIIKGQGTEVGSCDRSISNNIKVYSNL